MIDTNPLIVRQPVMIVDDRVENRVALRAILEPLSVPIVEMASGDEALRHLLERDCALILLDVDMPQMDGFQTAAFVKEHPRTKHIPIIFLTAYDVLLDHAGEGYSFGAVDYIAKPFDPNVLRAKVRVFLELQDKNALLEHQTRRLEQHVEQLRLSRAALADAQRIANLGSWEYNPQTGVLRGSRQFHDIFGEPADVPLPAAEELFDRLRLRPDDISGTALLHSATRTNFEGELVRADGRRRHVVVHGEPKTDTLTMIGTIQDVTEPREAQRVLDEMAGELERERGIVQAFQQAVAAPTLRCDPAISISYCYRPAEPAPVGGDWYDVFQLQQGELLLAIGDVAGHGLQAASIMSDTRTALRSMSIREASPAVLCRELNRYLRTFHEGSYATILLVRLNQATGECVAASAGHPPPVRFDGEKADFEWLTPGPPLGTRSGRVFEVSFRLAPGESLAMYTDGLVERRGELLDDGLMRLRKLVPTLDPAASTLAGDIVEDLCADADLRDDVAVLAVHFGHTQAGLHMSKPARLGEIAPLRALLRRWFAAAGAEAEWIEDMVVAISETLANVCIHAYRPGTAGIFTLDVQLDGDRVEVVVRDSGEWRRRRTQGGGRGLTIVKALVPDTTIESTPSGTTVRLRARRWDERDAG